MPENKEQYINKNIHFENKKFFLDITLLTYLYQKNLSII